MPCFKHPSLHISRNERKCRKVKVRGTPSVFRKTELKVRSMTYIHFTFMYKHHVFHRNMRLHSSFPSKEVRMFSYPHILWCALSGQHTHSYSTKMELIDTLVTPVCPKSCPAVSLTCNKETSVTSLNNQCRWNVGKEQYTYVTKRRCLHHYVYL